MQKKMYMVLTTFLILFEIYTFSLVLIILSKLLGRRALIFIILLAILPLLLILLVSLSGLSIIQSIFLFIIILSFITEALLYYLFDLALSTVAIIILASLLISLITYSLIISPIYVYSASSQLLPIIIQSPLY